MHNIGVICRPGIGHLNPMCVLGQELRRRGHAVTVFGPAEMGGAVANARLPFEAFGADSDVDGALNRERAASQSRHGLAATTARLRFMLGDLQRVFDCAPRLLRSAGIDLLAVNHLEAGAATLAHHLGLPFVAVSCAVPVTDEPRIPPFFTSWAYNEAAWARLRNVAARRAVSGLWKPLRDRIARQRALWSLPDQWSDGPRLQLNQLTAEFDFPHERLPAGFHYTGPFQTESGLEPTLPASLTFPFEKLDGKTVVYATLGTLQSGRTTMFETIARACEGLGVQLVVSLGAPEPGGALPKLSGSPLTVSYAPHQQLISRADVVITHGGINTVMGALQAATPMVVVPITFDQPGVGARVARSGAGEVVSLSRLSPPTLRTAVEKVLSQPRYRHRADNARQDVLRAGGVRRAADLIETALP
jgi:zeaxanthin glucosyltransferase